MATESEIMNYLRLRRAGKTALECKVELKLTLETMRECEHLLWAFPHEAIVGEPGASA